MVSSSLGPVIGLLLWAVADRANWLPEFPLRGGASRETLLSEVDLFAGGGLQIYLSPWVIGMYSGTELGEGRLFVFPRLACGPAVLLLRLQVVSSVGVPLGPVGPG